MSGYSPGLGLALNPQQFAQGSTPLEQVALFRETGLGPDAAAGQCEVRESLQRQYVAPIAGIRKCSRKRGDEQ
jgi:hypothetical protein